MPPSLNNAPSISLTTGTNNKKDTHTAFAQKSGSMKYLGYNVNIPEFLCNFGICCQPASYLGSFLASAAPSGTHLF